MPRTNSGCHLPPRRIGRAALLALSVVGAACTNVVGPDGGGTGRSPDIPAFVFVSDQSGVEQLWRFRNDSIVRLTFSDWTDRDPHSAAGRLVFTSYRDGDAEIYTADTDGNDPVRLTTSSGLDVQPSLSPDGLRVAFVSTRSGTPRLWVMGATGAGSPPTAIETGSPTLVPERAPAWSPSGDRIAFTSTRTGTSQVYVMPASGGAAVQVTFESGGAFDPHWSADGASLVYTTTVSLTVIRRVTLASGELANYAMGSDNLGQASCTATHCLVVSGAYGTDGDIVAYSGEGTEPVPVVIGGSNAVRPAVLVAAAP